MYDHLLLSLGGLLYCGKSFSITLVAGMSGVLRGKNQPTVVVRIVEVVHRKGPGLWISK